MTKSKSSYPEPKAVLASEAADPGLLRLDSDISLTNHRVATNADEVTLNFADPNRDRFSISPQEDEFVAPSAMQSAHLNSESEDAGLMTAAVLPQISSGSASHQNSQASLQASLAAIHDGSPSVIQQGRGIFRIAPRIGNDSFDAPTLLVAPIQLRSTIHRADASTFTQAQIDQLKDGVSQVFAPLDAALGAQVYLEKLPLLGTALKSAFDSNQGGLHDVQLLRDTINGALNSLSGSATYTQAQVENAINTALTNAGFVGSSAQAVFNGSDVRLNFVTDRQSAPLTTSLDSDLGLPGLGIQTNGSASTILDYRFNFGVGVDGSGFYLDTSNPTFRVGFDTTLPGFGAAAMIGPLNFTANDLASDPTDFNAGFGIQLKDPNNDGKLRPNELSGSPDLLDATLTGSAKVDLHLASNLGTAVLPDIGADLHFNWNFNSDVVNPGASQTNFGSTPSVSFKNVSLGVGTFFTDFASPVFSLIQPLTAVLEPIVDLLETPVPLLDQLGISANILDLAEALGQIDQADADRLRLYEKVITFINHFPTSGEGRLDLGDFNFGGSDPRAANFLLANVIPNLARVADGIASQSPALGDFLSEAASLASPGQPNSGPQFPLLTDPNTAFNLLLGRPVDFFLYNMPNEEFHIANFDQFIPLLGPLGIELKGGLNVLLDTGFGYDSTGVAQFAQSHDAGDIFNGFYIRQSIDPMTGLPRPIASLNASLAAFAAVDVDIASIGVGGGLAASLFATLGDPNHDGKVHLDEFGEQFEIAPDCVFDLGGALTAGLSAYLDVGIGPFSHSFNYDIAQTTLLDFSFHCPPGEEPVLGRTLLANGALALNVGSDSGLRLLGDLADDNEEFNVVHLSGDAAHEEVGVSYQTQNGFQPGSSSAGMAPQQHSANGLITADGGAANDALVLDPGVLTNAQLSGGAGNDFLQGGSGNDTLDAGPGFDRLNGEAGVDSLFGGADNDLLDGGASADTINGGPGDDTATYASAAAPIYINLATGQSSGDAAGDSYISIERFSGSNFNDTLIGSDGNDTLMGLAGDDQISGGIGNDQLEGGPGADTLDGGSGFDGISFVTSPVPVSINLQTQVSSGGDATGDVFLSIEALEGSAGNDTFVGSGADEFFYGGGGNDNIDAGAGNDVVHGGSNNAALTYSGNGDITGFSAPGDTLAGGAGNDTLSFEGFSKQAPDNVAPGVHLGVVINLATGQTGGAASGITISGFENIIGTNYGDDLTGDDGPNFFDPLRGGGSNGTNHSSNVSGGGPDRIDGGAGEDTLRIDFSVADPANSLGIFTGGAGFSRNTIGNTSTIDSYSYLNIEDLQITGASKDDLIYASFLNGNDTLAGLAGNDTLGGHGGSDILLGGDGNDILAGQASPGANNGAPGYTGVAGGHDVFDGGAGDDLVEDVAFNIDNFNGFFLSAGALFQLDGGAGIDTLSADFSNESGAIVWNSAAPTNLEFADGAYARNFEQLRNFASGSGNDSITQLGRADNRFALGDGNDTVQPGLGVDTVFGGAGNDLLILDYTAGDGPTAFGVDSSSNGGDGGSFRRFDPATGTYIDNLAFREIERLQVTGSSHDDTLTGTNVGDDTLDGADGNDSIFGRDGNDHLFGGNGNDHLFGDNGDDLLTGGAGNDTVEGSVGNDNLDGGDGTDYLLGGANNDTLAGGAGNDTLDGGSFADSMKGGAGNDVYYVENPGDSVIEVATEGIDTVITSTDYTLGPNLENLMIADFSAATATGNNSDNVLTGSQQNNLLSGLRGNDTLIGDGTVNRGGSQRDTLTGGAGGDLFILGTSSGRFYDDNNSGTNGQNDYALITDFAPAAGDRLQLFGSAGQYLLSPSPLGNVPGTGLYLDQNSNGTFDSTDELMAILQSPVALTRGNVIDSALFLGGGRPGHIGGRDSIHSGNGDDAYRLGSSELAASSDPFLNSDHATLLSPLSGRPAVLADPETFLGSHSMSGIGRAPV